jgi:hypothetical protein
LVRPTPWSGRRPPFVGREETVKDTVRRTEVEVEEVGTEARKSD